MAPPFDSRAVTRELRRVVGPTLRGAGFRTSSGRTWWRRSADRTEVVCFQSFSDYLASGVGCTTHSFAVRLAMHPHCVPHDQPERWAADATSAPREWEGSFRRTLMRPFAQREISRRDIWYVGPEGEHLDDVIASTERVVREEGLAWFVSLSDPQEQLRVLLDERESEETVWGMGGRPSPRRDFLTGYVALTLGRHDLAREHLRRARTSGCYDYSVATLDEAIRAASVDGNSPEGGEA
jgi:hypothetical protein